MCVRETKGADKQATDRLQKQNIATGVLKEEKSLFPEDCEATTSASTGLSFSKHEG